VQSLTTYSILENFVSITNHQYTYHVFSCSVSVLQDALSWYTYDAAITISTTSIAKRKVDYDDRGAFNMFQGLMHSWVGYKLVKVLLAFGLSQKMG
jgi:hypothetical protein